MGVLPKELVVFPAIAPHSESRTLACRPPLATEQRAFNLRASLSYELAPPDQPSTNECTLRRRRHRSPVGAGPGQAPPGTVYRHQIGRASCREGVWKKVWISGGGVALN